MTRTKPPSSEYPTPPPFPTKATTSTSLLGKLYGAVASFFSRLVRIFSKERNWWRPIRLHHSMSNCKYLRHMDHDPGVDETPATLFKSLRFLPSGHSVPLQIKQGHCKPTSPYRIFFNLYKPSTPFKKTAPPPADFSIVVVKCVLTSSYAAVFSSDP